MKSMGHILCNCWIFPFVKPIHACIHIHTFAQAQRVIEMHFFSLFCLFLVVVHFVLHQLCKTDETKIEWNGFLCLFHSIVSVSRRTNRHQSNMVWVRRFVDKHSNEKAGIQNNYNNAVLHFNIWNKNLFFRFQCDDNDNKSFETNSFCMESDGKAFVSQ